MSEQVSLKSAEVKKLVNDKFDSSQMRGIEIRVRRQNR
jgi:hypothetical protein